MEALPRVGLGSWRPVRSGPSLARWIAVFAALAASGCAFDFSEYWEADEELCGIRVKWNGQGDRAAFCPEVERCRANLARALDDGPAVEFVTDATGPCLAQAAGCFAADFDHIYLTKAEAIADTPLCHELLHRALYYERGDPDYGHVSEEWSRTR